MSKNKLADIPSANEKYIISAPIIYKNFTRKNAEEMDFSEMYIQRSTEDFFIKFCESKINRKDLEDCLSKIDGEIKAPTLEVEFLEGNWDICDENELMQSRIGKYVIIHRIIEENN